MSQLKVIAEVTGKVWKIQMSEGAQVSEDDSIMVVESMKFLKEYSDSNHQPQYAVKEG